MPENGRLQIPGSSNQRPSTKCRWITPEDVRTYLEGEDSFDSDSSCSSTEKALHLEAFCTSYVDSPNFRNETTLMVTEADLKLETHKPEPSAKKLEVIVNQLPAVQNLSVLPVPSVVSVDLSSEANAITPLTATKVNINNEPFKHVEPPSRKLEQPIHQLQTVEPQSSSSSPSDIIDESTKVNTKVSGAHLKPEPLEHAHSPAINLEESLYQPVAVERLSAPSVPSDVTKDNSSNVNAETSPNVAQPDLKLEPRKNAANSKAKSSIAKVNLLAVRKARLPSHVAAIRPLQKLAAQETGPIGETSDKNTLVVHDPNSNRNLPESKPADSSSAVRSAEKPNRHLKIPGLPGSAKARTVRQVFAPISNQWNYSLPTPGSQHDNERTSEFSVVQTVSVTSELTVRVEDSKVDELKTQSLAEAVFGSPVKWADDSLDSPVIEGSANSRKTTYYSIFGSSLKNVDSNSSEHPFIVPPGAYEDSCGTNQIPEKVQKAAPQVAQLQKQSQTSQDSLREAETVPEEKSISLNENEKVTAASSICPPPPPSSVIKKHISLFSPVKNSKFSDHSLVADDLSKSNTGIFFPFPKPKYEDSVLGQFDDTAQFVSALASNFKVSSEISPLSTPTKTVEDSNHAQSVIVNNPTSFQEVFKKNVSEKPHQVNEPSNLDKGSVGTTVPVVSNISIIPNGLSGDKNAAEFPNLSVLPTDSAKEGIEAENMSGGSAENPRPQTTIEPPTITVTPPKTNSSPRYDGSFRIIHRPNLASSSVSYSVKSWFPKGTPVNEVTPRRTPRLATKANCSPSPKGPAKFSIDDAFIFEQEERVKRWELDHSNESTLGVSAIKSTNGSPTRKRTELPGKVSPSKKSPKKHSSPCKSPRRAEVCRNLHQQTQETMHELVPDSAKQPELGTFAHPAVPQEPKSLADTTPKLLSMLSTLLNNTNRLEPRAESSADTSQPEEKYTIKPHNLAISQVETKCSVNAESSDRSEPLSTVISNHEIAPSQVAPFDHSIPCSNVGGDELCRKNAPGEQTPIVKSSKSHNDGTVQIDTPRDASLELTKNDYVPVDPSLGENKGITESYPACSDLAVPGLSSATLATVSQVTTVGHVRPSIKEEVTRRNAKSNASVTPKPSGSSDYPNIPASDDAKSNGIPIGKYASIIARVKPTTPLNRSVAALIKCTVNSANNSAPLLSARPRPTTPMVQSTKKTNFKRSSALKSNNNDVAGNSLMKSIRSTFFQRPPTSSAKRNISGAQDGTPTSTVIDRRSASNLDVKSAKITTYQNNADIAGRERVDSSRTSEKTIVQDASAKRNDVAVSTKPVEMERNPPNQWKLLELERPSKPISLLQKFLSSSKNIAPQNKETSGNSKSTSPAAHCDEQNGAKTELEPPPCSNRAVESRSDVQVIPNSGGVEMMNATPPPVFSKSCPRKTILLDCPLKLETPTKNRKRSGDLKESSQPKEKPVTPIKKDSKEKHAETESRHYDRKENIEEKPAKESVKRHAERDPKRKKEEKEEAERVSRYYDRRENIEKTPAKESVKKHAERESRRFVLPRKSVRIDIRARYFERYPKRSVSREVSSKRLRAVKRGVSPQQRHRKTSHSRHGSEERSAERKSEAMTPFKKSHHKDRASKTSSSGRKSKITSAEHGGEQSKNSSDTIGRRSRSVSPGLSGRRLKDSSKSANRPSNSNSREPDKITSPEESVRENSVHAQVVSKSENPKSTATPALQIQPPATSAITTFKKLGLLGRRPASFSST